MGCDRWGVTDGRDMTEEETQEKGVRRMVMTKV